MMARIMRVPQHIAIVMDGNGRWARRRMLPRIAGHRQGIESLRRCVRTCIQHGIKALTVFAFSSENWQRPPEEVSGLMDLLVLALGREVKPLHDSGVQIRFAGDLSRLSDRVQQGLGDAVGLTAGNSTLTLTICFNYGGRWDVVQAATQLVNAGEPISEEALSRAHALAHVPDPELVIRTGGEQRISNFLLWQSAYSELYFTDALWPDFDEIELGKALDDFAKRERRFGKTSEQVSSPPADLKLA